MSTGILETTVSVNIKWQEITSVLVSLGLHQAEIDTCRIKVEHWGKEVCCDVENDCADSATLINMAAAAPSPLTSSVEKTNGAKLSRLLIDGGTTTLRNLK